MKFEWVCNLNTTGSIRLHIKGEETHSIIIFVGISVEGGRQGGRGHIPLPFQFWPLIYKSYVFFME
jgi:hypothetical protein